MPLVIPIFPSRATTPAYKPPPRPCRHSQPLSSNTRFPPYNAAPLRPPVRGRYHHGRHARDNSAARRPGTSGISAPLGPPPPLPAALLYFGKDWGCHRGMATLIYDLHATIGFKSLLILRGDCGLPPAGVSACLLLWLGLRMSEDGKCHVDAALSWS